jgi:hypothetical protein
MITRRDWAFLGFCVVQLIAVALFFGRLDARVVQLEADYVSLKGMPVLAARTEERVIYMSRQLDEMRADLKAAMATRPR